MEPPVAAAPPCAGCRTSCGATPSRSASSRPRAILLVVWIVYPTIYTIIRSFFGKDAHEGFLPTAIRRVRQLQGALHDGHPRDGDQEQRDLDPRSRRPLVTAIGLVFAVLTERIRWAVAFKTIVFMPMAISLFATGVIWHVMYIKDPQQGAVNAGIGAVKSWFSPPGALQDANAVDARRSPARRRRASCCRSRSQAGGTAQLGLTAIPPDEVPCGAEQAVTPQPKSGAVDGHRLARLQPRRRHAGQGRAGRARHPRREGRPARLVAARSVQIDDDRRRTARSSSTTSRARG